MSALGSAGKWVDHERSWHDTKTVSCPICGKLIPRRSWEFADGDALIQVCTPECEELYVSYWRPRNGHLNPSGGNDR
ncbi:MAG TPA: hypothetical protein VH063_04025 [Gaiellaceae bacterium]|nr:hypothetical protein [Gaiellaceae bacterium]